MSVNQPMSVPETCQVLYTTIHHLPVNREIACQRESFNVLECIPTKIFPFRTVLVLFKTLLTCSCSYAWRKYRQRRGRKKEKARELKKEKFSQREKRENEYSPL